MKKTIIAAAALLIAAFQSFAQEEAGTFTIAPTAGISIASTTADDAKSKAGFVGGVDFGYKFTRVFALNAGVMFSMEGAKEKSGDVKLNLNYINIPVMANFYVFKGLALKAGVQPGFLASANAKSNGQSIDMKDSMKKVNFSIPLGASYEIAHFILDARYNIGLTEMSDLGDAKGGAFQITLGYKFPINK